MILANTDLLIDYLAGAQPTTAQIRGYLETDQLQTSAVTWFELLSGATPGNHGDSFRALLAALPVLHLDRQAAESAAEVQRELDGAADRHGR